MKKLFLFSFLLFIQSVYSQKISEKSLLWEISGKGLENPSYLYGTIHVACEGDELITDRIKSVFDRTESLALEADLSDPGLQTKLMSISFAKDGKKMTDRLGSDTAAKLDSLLTSKTGIGLSMMETLSPQIMLAQLSLLGLDCQMSPGYDMVFMNMAKTEGKEIHGLESIDTQINALFSQTDEEAVKAITHIVNHPDELKEEMTKLLDLYNQKDVQGLYDYTRLKFEDPDYPMTDIKVFLDNRNISWIPEIEKLTAGKPVFIAVGAAHLAGENGVINLLRKQGYILKPMQ